MGALDEARAQLVAAFKAWDWTDAFAGVPGTYTAAKAPILVQGWPYDLIDNILSENNGLMTQPLISFVTTPATDTNRALGDHFGPGASGKQRYGTRIKVTLAIVCWADQQMGGGDMVEKLAGQVQGCTFYNRSRLAAYRQLSCEALMEAYRDRHSLWRFDLAVHGYGIVSYDA